LKIIKSSPEHIPTVSDLFCRAFADSINFFAPDNPKIIKAVADIFNLILHSAGEGFFVAVDDKENVYGYIVVIGDIRRLWKDAFVSGFAFRALYRWLAGSYGIGTASVIRVIRNKIFYMGFEMGTKPAGQILSVAVHPDWQGQGIGKALVDSGLDLLHSNGVDTIKLEVRPENTAAIRIYSQYGFVERGRTRDLQGEWIVMQIG